MESWRGAAASERTTCVRASVPSLAPEIRQVTDEEPSCGCRRVTARLRRMAHRPQALIAHLARGQLAATSPTTGGAVHITTMRAYLIPTAYGPLRIANWSHGGAGVTMGAGK